ncbi:hypothetical protein LEM8419_00279 [Neolewinella maritima]|uniref:Capsular biosynthesis protein n=1 Tax=Neolewinella maritima TaxID=1383882 RepID=A0ABN8F2N6_9BACT|nr:hypothetical protein [Neolewinella maritima]CAH0998984.1 hypothetical protein LEM8419_00279 [Neolewinella maritima]
MTTLFLSLQGISPLHQATEAELIQQRLRAGHEVVVLHCGACLRSCSLNSTHNLLGCAVCQARAHATADQAGVRTRQLDRSLFPAQYGEAPATVGELMELTYEGINIGRGVASSTISILRDYDVQPRGRHRALVELECCNAVGALRNYRRVLDEVRPSEVVLFNGRHSELWPMVELCRDRGIDYVCHERGGSIQLYQEFRNSLPHSIAARRRLMNELWDSTPADERERRASAWYEQKRRGTASDDRSYLDAMTTGQLPDDFDPAKHNIVVFNSSEDEMQAIAEWRTPLYTNQNEAITAVLAQLRGRDDVHVYIRMHPNLSVVDNAQTQELYALQQDNLTLLRPTDTVDTYTLCDHADVVLAFASTIGVEATYWGTASVLYGRAFYEGEGAVYHPQTFAELMKTLTTPGLPPCTRPDSVGTLKYGLFASSYGKPYSYARIEGPKTAYVAGNKLRRFSAGTARRLLRYLPRLSDWLRTHRIVTGRRLRLSELAKLYSHLRRKA